jgi:hypothetical protein
MKIKYFIIILSLKILAALHLNCQSNYCYSIDRSNPKWHSPDTVSTGINEPILWGDILSIDVFPNPFENNIKLKIISKKPQYIEIRIINILGIEMFIQNDCFISKDDDILIDIKSDLPKGIYLLIITRITVDRENKSVMCYKLVKY